MGKGKPLVGMNPVVLRWARERSGRSVDDVARELKLDQRLIQAWESGDGAPTYAQLEALAYGSFKRPIALFFFPEPPEELDPRHAFRTLPDFEVAQMTSDTRYALRQAQAMQIALRELQDGRNVAPRLIFRDLRANPSVGARLFAEHVREYLKVSLSSQTDCRDISAALDTWRAAVEECGVYVFRRSMKQHGISGFALWDEEFPVIYLNSSTSMSRQLFSLIHELAHILVRESGVTLEDDSYISSMDVGDRRTEVFCNALAGEVLVPSAYFEALPQSSAFAEEHVSDLADSFKVSREVILRKYLDRGLISAAEYRTLASRWNREFEQRRYSNGRRGANYYATHLKSLGRTYLRLAFRRYHEGRFDLGQLGDYLHVKATSVPELEARFLRGEAR